MNLQKFHLYTSIHGHYVIPFEQDCDYWICKVFYYNKENGHIYNQGCFAYKNDGICTSDRTKKHNICKETYLKTLQNDKLKKIIIAWKKYYKESRNV